MLSACSKSGTGNNDGGDDGPHVVTPTDTTPPEISIYTPTTGQVFSSGNTITITGRLTDDLGLYRGTIKVINDATGAALHSQAYEIHGLRLYNFNLSYTPSVSAASDYSVVVTFEDHGLNSTAKSVSVKVNP